MKIVPFQDLRMLHEDINSEINLAFEKFLSSNHYILGPELEAFESEFADFCEAKYCVGVGNGLDALYLLLRAYEIGPGDEVIVPSNTFVATWLAVSQCGATPVAVEPDVNTWNIDPLLIEHSITSNTKAIIPVHLYGQPVDIDSINEIASRYGLIVIDDAAQAHGAKYKNKRIGSLCNATAFSFYPSKNLGALGDGGAIVTNDEIITKKVRLLRNYGSKEKYRHDVLGHNSRLDELQAAFLRIKLRHLDKLNSRRSEIAATYVNELNNLDFILPTVSNWAKSVWHLFVIRCEEREKLQLFLKNKGIETLVHYPIPPYKQLIYNQLKVKNMPITDMLSGQVLSLPMHPSLRNDQLDKVISSLKEFRKLNS